MVSNEKSNFFKMFLILLIIDKRIFNMDLTFVIQNHFWKNKPQEWIL